MPGYTEAIRQQDGAQGNREDEDGDPQTPRSRTLDLATQDP